MNRAASRVPVRCTCFGCGAALAEDVPFAVIGADRRPRWVCIDCMRQALARHDQAEREQIELLGEMLRSAALRGAGGGLDVA